MRADIHDGQGAKTLRSMGRIQMRETNYLQIIKSGLHRTAGPYRSTRSRHHRAYSITSSARANRVGGKSTPIAFAALVLTTNSNLVGC